MGVDFSNQRGKLKKKGMISAVRWVGALTHPSNSDNQNGDGGGLV